MLLKSIYIISGILLLGSLFFVEAGEQTPAFADEAHTVFDPGDDTRSPDPISNQQNSITLKESGPITATKNGQVIENLRITSTSGAAITVNGKSNVTIRNVEIFHRGGHGIHLNNAPGTHIENVNIVYTGARPFQPNPAEHNNIHVWGSPDVRIHRARLRDGSTGVFTWASPRPHLSFIEGYNFRGDFPRGQIVQFAAHSDDCILEDFYNYNDPKISWPEDNINVWHTSRCVIRRGLIDGNNESNGVGVMIEMSAGQGDVALVEDVDTIRMGNGCFSAYPGRDVTFRNTNCRENICTNQGRGVPTSNALMYAASSGSENIRLENSKYWASCNGNLVWKKDMFSVIDLRKEDFKLREPILLTFPWEEGGGDPVDEVPPTAPANLGASASGEAVSLSWQAAEDPESGIGSYNIYRSEGSGSPSMIASVSGSTLEYTDHPSTPGVFYAYQVSAVNGAGLEGPKSNKVVASIVDAVPAAPSNLVATPGDTTVSLDWGNSPEADLAGYNIYRSDDSGASFNKLNASPMGASNFNDTGLTNDFTYVYQVTAMDNAGQESAPAQAKATPMEVDSLAGYWTFDEGSGSTAADSSGNGNNGTLHNGANWEAGKFGSGVSFDGTAALVDFGSSSDFDSPSFTIAMWVKPNKWNSGGVWSNMLMGREQYKQAGFRMGVADGGNVRFWTGQSGGNLIAVASQAMALGKFNHLAVTYDAGSDLLTIYLDGVAVASETGKYVAPVGQSLALGDAVGGTEHADAVFDDLRLYNQPLSPAEVQALALVEPSDDNQAPRVSAGDDMVVTMASPAVANLDGSAHDDGRPDGNLFYQWSASGPAPVVFGDANSASTTATFGTAGDYQMTLAVSDGELEGSDSLMVSVVAEPDPGELLPIPGRIQAEDYNEGGEGVAYHDTTSGNNGGQYRHDDVDIQSTADVGGGYNVGWIKKGEWLAYGVDVKPGTYDITARVASNASGVKSLHLEVDGVDVTGPLSFSHSSGWQDWHDVTVTGVTLAGGPHELRVVMDADSFNVNYLDFALQGPPENQAPQADAGANQARTDADGDGFEKFTLDGSASSDADGTIVSYMWTEGGQQVATGVNPTVSLALGVHQLTLTVTDDDGAKDTDTVTVTVSVLYGDVDGDGDFDADDLHTFMDWLIGLAPMPAPETRAFLAGDVNGDGNLDIDDMSLMIQKLSGDIDQFPME